MKNKLRTILLPLSLTAVFGAGFFANQALADQPMMNRALDQLHGAEDALLHAKDDKGGHRGKAIRLINAAIEETQLGIQYAHDH